jgi:hypothetical protein
MDKDRAGDRIQERTLTGARISSVQSGEYGGVFHQNVHRYNFGIFGDNFSKILTGGIYGDWGKYIVRFEDPSFVGHGFNINLYATVKPFDRLRNDIEYSYSQLARSSGGELLVCRVCDQRQNLLSVQQEFLSPCAAAI